MRTIAALLLFAIAGIVQAADVNVAWQGPTVCSDGSALTNCAATGYEIYMGTSLTGTTYVKRAETPAATATSATLAGVAAGNRCFFMKTVSGVAVSGESNRVCVNIPVINPNAPVITVTIAVTQP